MLHHQFIRKILFFFALSCQFLFGRQLVCPSYVAHVIGDHVNLRSHPDIRSEILGMVLAGQELFVIKSERLWAQVFLPETVSLWIHSKLVCTKEGGHRGVVLKDGVHLRIEPNVRSFSVGLVYENQNLVILDQRFNWYRVKIPKKSFFAWISVEFIEKMIDYAVYLDRSKNKKIEEIYQKLEEEYLNVMLFVPREKDFSYFLECYKSFIKKYPEAKQNDFVKKRIDELIQKKMNFYWLQLEKRFLLKGKSRNEQLSLLLDYQNFQKNYPHNSHFKFSKKRISFLVNAQKNQKKEKLEGKIFSGVVQDLGVLLHRPARYKLVHDKEILCFLRSKTIDLSDYVSHFVEIRGKMFWHKNHKIPVLEASCVVTRDWQGG